MQKIAAGLLVSCIACCAVPDRPVVTDVGEVNMDQRTEELQELRFGMFICWSFSTFSGREWTRGVEDVSFFEATGCDTDQWCRAANGPIEYIWFDHAVGTGGLSHPETIAWCKKLQPGCFIGFNHGDQTGADIRLGEMGRPGPLSEQGAAGPHMRDAPSESYRMAEFTYPILPPHKGGAMWFYSLPEHDDLCRPAEKIYADYLGAERYGNIFSLDVGPMPNGELRPIDVETLRQVGCYVRGEIELRLPVSQGKKATASSVWESDEGFGPAAAFDEGGWNRVSRFCLQYERDDQWETIVAGSIVGARKELEFEPVTGQRFRLSILEAQDVPTVLEFELWSAERP